MEFSCVDTIIVDTIIKVIPTVSTLFVLIVGWFVGNYFSANRAQVNKRRDLRTKFLIEAYRILTNKISQRGPSALIENKIEFENLISDIQLFGTVEQVKLAKKLANDVEKLANDVENHPDADLDPLIKNLRKSLRKELSLEPVDGNVQWLRIEKSDKK